MGDNLEHQVVINNTKYWRKAGEHCLHFRKKLV